MLEGGGSVECKCLTLTMMTFKLGACSCYLAGIHQGFAMLAS